MNFYLFLPYAVGTMVGSVCGVKISIFIERLLGASADGHLTKSKQVTTKVINADLDKTQIQDYLTSKEGRKMIADIVKGN